MKYAFVLFVLVILTSTIFTEDGAPRDDEGNLITPDEQALEKNKGVKDDSGSERWRTTKGYKRHPKVKRKKRDDYSAANKGVKDDSGSERWRTTKDGLHPKVKRKKRDDYSAANKGVKDDSRSERRRTTKDGPHPKVKRKKRDDYSAADSYNYNYDYDYNYEDDDLEDKSFFERFDSKLTKKYIITAAVIGNISLCLLCTCCLIICTACSELARGLGEMAMFWYDIVCCIEPPYRDMCRIYKRLDLKCPTYDEYLLLRDSCGAEANFEFGKPT